MTYSWIATSLYNTALQRMLYFVLAKTIERYVRPVSKDLTKKYYILLIFLSFHAIK